MSYRGIILHGQLPCSSAYRKFELLHVNLSGGKGLQGAGPLPAAGGGRAQKRHVVVVLRKKQVSGNGVLLCTPYGYLTVHYLENLTLSKLFQSNYRTWKLIKGYVRALVEMRPLI